jgi:anti-anti-sigma factor
MFRLETVAGDETILTAVGPIAGESVAEFGRKIKALVAGRATTVTLDLSHAEGMSSDAIGKLLELKKQLVEQKRVLRIQGCSDTLWDVFKRIKLDSLIPMQK